MGVDLGPLGGRSRGSNRNRGAQKCYVTNVEIPPDTEAVDTTFVSRASGKTLSGASRHTEGDTQIKPNDVKHDIDIVLWSMKLCSIRRYSHHRDEHGNVISSAVGRGRIERAAEYLEGLGVDSSRLRSRLDHLPI